MRYVNGYTIGGILFAAVAASALAVTTLIIAQSGDMQGATDAGKWLLSWAALVVHLGGVVAFGMMAGYHSAEGHKGSSRFYTAIMLAAALYSGWQVASFATAEIASQRHAREIAEKQEDARFKADLALTAKRLELQGKLAADQIKANAAAAKHADGRREKRDAMEESRKLIADVGKIDVPMPAVQPPPPSISRRTQEFAGWVASLIRLDLSAVQAAPTVHLTFMLLLFEVVCWPQAAKNFRLGLIKAARVKEEREKAAPPPQLPPEPLQPVKLEEEPVRKALPPPKGQTRRDPTAITIRANPGRDWRALLDKIDFPPPGARHKGPLRAKGAREHAALRFLVWMGAYKEEGHFPQAEVEALYAEFCTMDHREPWGIRIVKSDLEAMGRRIANKWTGSDGLTWSIVPPPIEKMTALLERKGVIQGGVAGIVSPGVLRFPAAAKKTTTGGDAA